MAYDDAGNLCNSISFTLGAGPYNDLGETTLQTTVYGIVQRYQSGSTNRLVLTPASGGTTINGLDASGCSDGTQVLIVNGSSTDNLVFTHLGGGLSYNQFSNQNASSVAIAPLGAARAFYVVSKWQFA